MARINGSCTGSNGDKYDVWIDWSLLSQSITDNQSRVKVVLKLQRNDGYNSSAYNLNAINPVKLYVNGSLKVDKDIKIDTRNQAVVELAEWTGYITHSSDGTKSFAIKGNFEIKGVSNFTGGSVSGTATLPTIPRASQPSLSKTSFNIGEDITVKTNRKSTSFYHTVKLTYGGSTTTLATNVETSYTWDTNSLYAKTTTSNSGSGKILLITYNSDNDNIGQKEVSFSANVTNSNPTINTFTVEDTRATTLALTGNNNVIVLGESTATYAMTATMKNSATLKSYRVTNDSDVKTTSSGSFSSPVSGTFKATVTDSRNNQDTETVTKSTVLYLTPIFANLTLKRPTTTSDNATLSCDGSWFNGNFGTVANTLELKYRYRIQGGTYGNYITLTPTLGTNKFSYSGTLAPTFSFEESFEFQFVIVDKLHTTVKTVPLTYGKPIMDIGKTDVLINGDLLVRDYGVLHRGNTNKTLWTGSWSTGTITVPNFDKYELFQIQMEGQGTKILAIKHGVNFRGIGGMSTATPTIINFQFNSTVSGNDLTLVACNNCRPLDDSYSITNMTITAIKGIL